MIVVHLKNGDVHAWSAEKADVESAALVPTEASVEDNGTILKLRSSLETVVDGVKVRAGDLIASYNLAEVLWWERDGVRYERTRAAGFEGRPVKKK